jgi:hypothetical protein
VTGKSIESGNYDFTTICYHELETTPPSVVEQWVARENGPAGGDDRGLVVKAATQYLGGHEFAMACVTGVVQNSNGDWDWRTMKYDFTVPNGYPVNPKLPRWRIDFPQNIANSLGNDVPASLDIRFPFDYDSTSRCFVNGFSFGGVTANDAMTVQYKDIEPP